MRQISKMDKNMTFDDFYDMTKKELVTFLRQNKQKISGNKKQLALRAFDFKEHSFSNETANVDKKMVTHLETGDVPAIENLNYGWSGDHNKFPQLNHGSVEYYLLHSSQRTCDAEKMKCYRQFIRGFNFYKEKFIHKPMVNVINDDSKFCYVRSKCFPSYTKDVSTYTQWVLLSKDTPNEILKANCTCPAGLGEGCAHIAGLLFYLESTKVTEDPSGSDTPCTSKPCEWSKPSKRQREPCRVKDINFKKIKYDETKEKTTTVTNNRLPGVKSKGFLTTLCNHLDKTDPIVLFDLLPNHTQEEVPVSSDINVSNFEEVCTSEIIEYESDRYIDLKQTLESEQLCKDEFMKLGNVTESVVDEIELRTRGQSENVLWFTARSMRVTATKFHDINTKKHLNQLSCKNILSQCIEGKMDSLSDIPAVKWGKKHEKIAVKKYIAFKKLKFKENVKHTDCGLFLSKENGFLGASPDGIISSKERGERLIEIKCPYNCRYSTITAACQSKSFCCYIDGNGKICLKTNHRYYTQIQGQMAVCNFTKCDFVLYTTNDLKIIEIDFDPLFWKALKTKLEQFYYKLVVPHLFTS